MNLQYIYYILCVIFGVSLNITILIISFFLSECDINFFNLLMSEWLLLFAIHDILHIGFIIVPIIFLHYNGKHNIILTYLHLVCYISGFLIYILFGLSLIRNTDCLFELNWKNSIIIIYFIYQTILHNQYEKINKFLTTNLEVYN